MTDPVQNTKSSIIDQLEELPVLKTFPAAATRVLAVCDDDNTNARELVEIVQCEPTMSIQLLRVANSPAYGFGGQIKSLEHAAVVLGFRSVRNLAVSVAAASVFSDGDSAHQREALWQHSLACAIIARRLAALSHDVDQDEAFIAGMVHDVGKLVFFDLALDNYSYDPTKLVSTPTSEQELQEFGIDHGQVGNRCGMEWGLPEDINEAITHHHHPQSAQWAHELVSIIYAANRFAKLWGVGPTASNASDDPLDNIPDVELDISEEELAELRSQVPGEFADLSKAFSLSQ